ncbi:MAG: FAD-binding oxidoreductase [Paracoccaceae bacterium]
MKRALASQSPAKNSYDVVIIGGAMMGSSTAWFLASNPDFQGSILVVERDLTYQKSSTAHTNSCMRQQFSTMLNVQISQFAAEFVKNLRGYMGGDLRVPDLTIKNYGYLYLANKMAFADVLRDNQKVQLAAGAGTTLLTPEQILIKYPFYNVDDILLGSINTVDEGYWDGGTVFDWLGRSAREKGAEYINNEVIAMTKNQRGDRVESVTLVSGEVVESGLVVNASGPRASHTAQMLGIFIPVEPRKRFTWVFSARNPLDRELPLTIDPSGVHMRQDGPETYLAGGRSDKDPAVDYDDFSMDYGLWESHIWPIIAMRVPQFESIKVINEWAGHYAYNTLDQNAVIGPHGRVQNFLFINGFSGHGLQQSPAMGRGLSEHIIYGEYRSLDLSTFGYERVIKNEAIIERAII